MVTVKSVEVYVEAYLLWGHNELEPSVQQKFAKNNFCRFAGIAIFNAM